MSKKSDVTLCVEKVKELHTAYNTMKTAEGNKTTRNTKLYKIKRDERTITLIQHLIEQLPTDYKWEKSDRDTFILLTTLASERVTYEPIIVQEGDMIIDLLQKYDGRKDIMNKLTAACASVNCHMDFASGKVVANK